MQHTFDLTNTNIKKALFSIALPIMATSLIQMCYNLTDIMWLGRVGAGAVAASGTAGFFMWFSQSLQLIGKCGAEIGVARALGEKNTNKAQRYASCALTLSCLIGFAYLLLLLFLNKWLISFFDLGDPTVIRDAQLYLYFVLPGMAASFLSAIFSSIFIATADSKTPFKLSAVGLVFNIIFDPVLIFIADLGVTGAAIATSIAQIIVFILFLWQYRRNPLFRTTPLRPCLDAQITRQIIRWGLPTAIESGLFCAIAMIIAKIVAIYGYTYVAVQKVGSQIEAISWMSAQGFASALTAFISQNYGAAKKERIQTGYTYARKLCFFWGIATTIILFCFAKEVFSLFLPDPAALKGGIDYLKILALSQMPMCIELLNEGAFRGLGKTVPPSLTSVSLNLARIPLSLILIQTSLGVNGIWWSITLSSIIKGIVLNFWFQQEQKKIKFPSAPLQNVPSCDTQQL